MDPKSTFSLIRELGPYGPVVIVAVLYFADKWGWIRKPQPEGGKRYEESLEKLDRIGQSVKDIKTEMHDLHMWHDKEDNDGVKVWYVRKSLETAIDRLADNLEKQTLILAELVNKVNTTDNDVKEIKARINV